MPNVSRVICHVGHADTHVFRGCMKSLEPAACLELQSGCSERNRVMPRVLCATPGCPGDASGSCIHPIGLKKCGNCCSCSGHGRRSQRGGRHFGRKSIPVQADRGRMFLAYRVLQEAVSFLNEHTVGELAALNLHSTTGTRRALYRAARGRLLSESVAGGGDANAYLLDMLPFQLLQRVLFACGPDVVRGVDHPAEPQESTVASSQAGEATPASSSTPSASSGAAEPARSIRRRVETASASAASIPQPSASSSPVRAQRNSPGEGLQLQVLLAAVTADIVQEAVHAVLTFRPQAPPTSAPPEELQRQPQGHFLWDGVANTPAGPVCRTTDPFPVTRLQCGSAKSLQAWEAAGGNFCLHDRALGAAVFSDSLHHFLAARAHLREACGPLQSRRPPWADEVQAGAWVFTEIARAGLGEGRLHGYHGCSMHMLERAVAIGMETGWSGLKRGEHTYLGVYFHEAVRGRLCHNYTLYSALDATGFLVAPVVCISAPLNDPQSRKQMLRTSGEPQNLTYPDVCRIHGIWFHIVHTLQFWEGDASNWLYAEPRFCRELEPEPLEDRAVLEARSRTLAQQNRDMQDP